MTAWRPDGLKVLVVARDQGAERADWSSARVHVDGAAIEIDCPVDPPPVTVDKPDLPAVGAPRRDLRTAHHEARGPARGGDDDHRRLRRGVRPIEGSRAHRWRGSVALLRRPEHRA